MLDAPTGQMPCKARHLTEGQFGHLTRTPPPSDINNEIKND